jgi:hypothetical protein
MGSTAQDLRGNPVGSRDPRALDAAERALRAMVSFQAAPEAALDEAIELDPQWLLPQAMKIGHLLGSLDPAAHDTARAAWATASALEPAAPARERAHFAALAQLVEGRWHQACETWDALLLLHPRDGLALHWAGQWDFHRGDAAALRQRPARALPEWDERDPLFPFALGQYAFGLAECNLYAQAEDAGRRAAAAADCVPLAVQAVAQVMEQQGRFDDGAAWLRQHQPRWAEGHGRAEHLWWQMGLFRLEALDDVGVLRLVDAHFAAPQLQTPWARIDAASLLWRLKLLEVDVTERFQALAASWPLPDEHAGYHAFHDLHALLALLGAGDVHGAERWLARCAERAMQPEDARRSNHATAREVALPLMRALLAFARQDPASAATALYGLRRQAHRLGGSQVQRDLIDQTLLAACAQGAEPAIGRALFNERRMAKPATPLTRHWGERLGVAEPPQRA